MLLIEGSPADCRRVARVLLRNDGIAGTLALDRLTRRTFIIYRKNG
jgi:hypothetical protein